MKYKECEVIPISVEGLDSNISCSTCEYEGGNDPICINCDAHALSIGHWKPSEKSLKEWNLL